MKKMMLILVFILVCVPTVFSDWYLGGNLFLETYDGGEGTAYKISPTIGFILNNKFDWGINLILDSSVRSAYGGYLDDYYDLGIGLFCRYSFLHENNFKILGNFGLNYLFIHRGGDWNDQEIIRLSFSPVLQYELYDKFFLYTNIGFVNISYVMNEWRESYFDYHINLFTDGITLDSLSLGFYFLFDTSGKRFNEPEQRGNITARNRTTAIDSDDLTIGVSGNPGGFIFARPSICIELNKGNLYSDINIIIPSGGFGFLGTLNYFWHNYLGGFYLGGGLGYTLSLLNNIAEHNLTLGANIGFKFLFSSGIFLRAGGYAGMAFKSNENDSELDFYFNPNLSLGYSF